MIKFHIVIPTRERATTLYSTIKTCLDQSYENYEILICNNCSKDNTREVALSFQDSRIRYIETPNRFSMSHNWEFALSHIDDGYVIFIGDDDGMMPDALKKMAKIISETNTLAVVWKVHKYNWPSHIIPEFRNLFTFFLDYYYYPVLSKKTLIEVSKSFEYTRLPLIYHGAVSMEVVKKIKKKYGTFFKSQIPDIYSGVIIASEIERYIISQYPFSIGGHSFMSSGCSLTYGTSETQQTALKMFVEEDNIPFHPKLIQGSIGSVFIAEPFLKASDISNDIPEINFTG